MGQILSELMCVVEKQCLVFTEAKWFLARGERGKTVSHNALTNTEDVEAESVIHRLVDQLVRHAVKANMACQRNSPGTLSLHTHTKTQIVHTKHQINDYWFLF